MCEAEKLVKYICNECKLEFWVKPQEEPRFCPFCEMAILTKAD
jgi:DNA-directed RNA polymerase subunit RPC12/RpoP